MGQAVAPAAEDPSRFAARVTPQPDHWGGLGWRRLMSPAHVVLWFALGGLEEQRGCGPAGGPGFGRATAAVAAEGEA